MATLMQQAPYGTWHSPISAEHVATGSVRLEQLRLDGTTAYWCENRPDDGGRGVVVCHQPGSAPVDRTPPEFSVRTRLYEYGGNAYAVHDGVIWFVNDADQRIYRLAPGQAPVACTPADTTSRSRYGDLVVDPVHQRLLFVHEIHAPDGSVEHCIAALPLAGGVPATLVSGADFYAAPRPSPAGDQLAWMAWRHPFMPWDAAAVWLAALDDAGQPHDAHQIAGGVGDAAAQPAWSPAGALHLVAERSGWLNLYRWSTAGLTPLAPHDAEFAPPLWNVGPSNYGWADDGTLIASWTQHGRWSVGRIGADSGLQPFETPWVAIDQVHVHGRSVWAIVSTPTSLPGIARLDIDTGAWEYLRSPAPLPCDGACISHAEPLSFAGDDGVMAHGFLYRPHLPGWCAPADSRPPLLVLVHGGPTICSTPHLRLAIQYWTTRGIAVLDVNYAGSTSFGRAYRERLYGAWGVADVADACAGARALVRAGLVDPARLAISGGSAGGFTTLSALTFTDVFHVGASFYGISDLAALAHDTHKYEAHYTDQLIGPYPAAAERYRARSPLYHAAAVRVPVIFFQGLDDAIVPPDQTERLVAALRARGVRSAYIAFPGERHGFRHAATIARALRCEHAFYASVFGIEGGELLADAELLADHD
jgi:dienelactone hydrolase